MTAPQEERDEVEVLAAEFMERQRRGETPTIEEYVAKYPALSESIRDLFPVIAALEKLKTPRPGSGGVTPVAVPFERLGDYRLVREVGRGGMGIVYEAEQESLSRRVALKVLPPQLLPDSRHIVRFQREARMAAKLHHTNIVPVFGVGHHAGYHYYVMQFIEGAPLDRALREFLRGGAADLFEAARNGIAAPAASEPAVRPPTTVALEAAVATARAGGEARSDSHIPPPQSARYFESVARIGFQVANALGYAHAQGTLHRDIKPGNLLLDASGVVWVADFGLAKAMERESVSQTSDVVGTLRYMAPEQLGGKTDARSDLCSLGLTLYELLTLRPAHPATHRSSIIHEIANEEPPPPCRINPAIPRDLETIVMKAIARDPVHRYQTAAELAEDLQCYLEDRPIAARRIGPVERLWRWSRRNRAVASLAGTSAVLLVLIAVVATTAYFRTRSAMESELRHRERAEATSELALETLDRILARFAPTRLAPAGALSNAGATSDTSTDAASDSAAATQTDAAQLRVQSVLSRENAALLETLLGFFQEFAERAADDARLQRKVADANARLGDIHQRFGQLEQAKAAYDKALAAYTQLAEKALEPDAFVHERVHVHNESGKLMQEPFRAGEAQKCYRASLALLDALPEVRRATAEARFDRARTLYYMARLPFFGSPKDGMKGKGPEPRGPGGPKEGPEKSRDEPLKGDERPGPPRENDRPGPRGFGNEQRQSLERAIEVLTALSAEFPAAPEYRHLLACCYREISRFARDEEGESPLGRAIELLEKLVAEAPDVPDYRYDLCETCAMMTPRKFGTLMRGDAAVAAQVEPRLRKALALSDTLVAEFPTVPDYAASNVGIRFSLASVCGATARREESVTLLRAALATQTALARDYPEISSYRMGVDMFRMMLVRALRGLGRPADLQEARDMLVASAAEFEAKIASDTAPERSFLKRPLAEVYMELANVYSALGDEEKAVEARAKLQALGPFDWRGRGGPPSGKDRERH